MVIGYEERVRTVLSVALAAKEEAPFEGITVQVPILEEGSYKCCVRCLRREDDRLAGCDLRLFLNEEEDALDDEGSLDPDVVVGNALQLPPLDGREKDMWRQVWSTLASRFGSSFAQIVANSQELLTVRPPHVFPHLISIPLVVCADDWVLIVCDAPDGLHPLDVVLRHSYANIEPYSQDSNWLLAGLLESLAQLASRFVFPIFMPSLFKVDDSLWLSIEPLDAFLAMKRAEYGSSLTTPTLLSNLEAVTEEWRQCRLSNLDYLLILNEFAGRRRGDAHNHPLVPWVCDFSEERGGWRRLDRTKYRLNKGDDQLKEMFKREPAHHVPELLSDIGFMVYRARVESRETLCRHVRSKWVPREYPASLRRMYEWTPDECIPELYEDSSLLVSRHPDMPDLELPPFVKTPEEFIDWHRKMLESDEASSELHHWIDLAFGYQLKGDAAVSALNVPLAFVSRSHRQLQLTSAYISSSSPSTSSPSSTPTSTTVENGKSSTSSTVTTPSTTTPLLLTHGVVQLFTSPHPRRLPAQGHERASSKSLIGLSPFFESILNGEGLFLEKNQEEPVEEAAKKEKNTEENGDSLLRMYRKMLSKHRERYSTRDQCIQSVLLTICEISLAEHCVNLRPSAPYTERVQRAQRLLRQRASRLPPQLRVSLPRLLSATTCDGLGNGEGKSEESPSTVQLPPFKHLHVFLLHELSIPVEILSTHHRLATFYAYNALRRHSIAGTDERRKAQALYSEVEAARSALALSSRRPFHPVHPIFVQLFHVLVRDEETAILAVRRLYALACRIFSGDALRSLLQPLKRLLHNETTVKLVDRRFLLQLSITFGARVFLAEFLPTLVEAVASRNLDRSIVAKDSILWLARRYGPVVCARFISANLLRILASCYANFSEMTNGSTAGQDIFRITLDGEQWGARVEAALSEIALAYSVTFVTVQYLPFCADVVEGAHRRLSAQIEPALAAALRILRLSLRAMNDAHLMNYLEDIISERLLLRIVELVCSEQSIFSSNTIRRLLTAKTVSTMLDVAQRIGAENARLYVAKPFQLLFNTMTGLYEPGETLEMQPASDGGSVLLVACFPVWFVRSLVSRFATEWGMPLLSSFCTNPAALIPYLAPPPDAPPPPHVISVAGASGSSYHHFNQSSSSMGNRLVSLSSSSSFSPHRSSSLGGVATTSSDTSGSLSQLWCARVSAAVCDTGAKSRLDHLVLCSFTGHTAAVTGLAVVSSENSFVSASADKTVRLWTLSADRDTATCQYAYRGHTKGVQDVQLMATNAIGSADGTLQVWDPFRGVSLLQLEWPEETAKDNSSSTGSLTRLSSLDRHCLLAASTNHANIRLLDLRAGGWVAELAAAPGAGQARCMTSSRCGRRVAVALSNGALALFDPRTGRVSSIAHGNSTHPTALHFLPAGDAGSPTSGSSPLLLCSLDEAPSLFGATPRLALLRRLGESAAHAVAGADDDERALLLTAHNNNVVRVYSNAASQLDVETRLRSDVMSGQIVTAARFPLNDAFLFGSSNGSIRLVC